MLIKRPIVRLIIVVVSLVVCLSAGGTVLGLLKRKDLVIKRQRELDRITKENESLQSRLEETREDAYVERIARDKLGLVKEGETIVIVSQQDAGGGEQDVASDLANWRQWWEVFN